MSQGWISLHRKIMEHPFYKEKRKFSKFEAWIDMLLMANHKDNKFLLGNEFVTVQRGSFITSELKLMDRWGWSKTKVRSFLDLLENDEMIIKISDNKKTTITIVNYNDYQDLETTEKPQENHEETAERPRKDTNNNDNNENNDNKNIYSLSPVPYEKISELYNTVCKSLPKIQKLTDKRKRLIKSRWNKSEDLSVYTELFRKAEESDFLSGRNGKWTSCNFDWLMNENNMIKVLEGNYDNKESTKPAVDKKTRFHTQEQRTSNYTPAQLEAMAQKRREQSG